jgi:hypothetical protein
MNTYQLHVDTGSTALVTNAFAGFAGQAAVSKTAGNPFQCSIILGNRHRAIRSITLKNAQIPLGFYNVRAPYNTMNVNSVVYTVTPGNYSVTTLLSALNTTITSAVGAFSPGALNNNIQFSSSSGVATMNVQPLSMLSFLGFTGQQQGVAFYGTNSYIVNFDTYLSIWIENLGTSSIENSQITFKVPLTVGSGSIMQWAENSQYHQLVKVTDRGVRLDRLNIQVLDRYGNLLNNNGIDWSFTLEIESDT